jgi:hypothetical protein
MFLGRLAMIASASLNRAPATLQCRSRKPGTSVRHYRWCPTLVAAQR